MIKILYFLSAMALVNLVAAITIANVSGNLNNKNVEIVAHTPAPLPTPIIVVKQVVKKVTKYTQASPTSNGKNSVTPTQPENNPTTAPQIISPPTQPSGCIITLDGAKYDVTAFKNQHSGGDIFSCGSDMSTTFWNKHGQSELNTMQRYRI